MTYTAHHLLTSTKHDIPSFICSRSVVQWIRTIAELSTKGWLIMYSSDILLFSLGPSLYQEYYKFNHLSVCFTGPSDCKTEYKSTQHRLLRNTWRQCVLEQPLLDCRAIKEPVTLSRSATIIFPRNRRALLSIQSTSFSRKLWRACNSQGGV